MESMAWDLRHPYIPSTTVLGDIHMVGKVLCNDVEQVFFIIRRDFCSITTNHETTIPVIKVQFNTDTCCTHGRLQTSVLRNNRQYKQETMTTIPVTKVEFNEELGKPALCI